MDLIDGLKAFVATAQTGSFTEAAKQLGISNRLTSKYVAELESRIGARLLQRTTRKVGLTPTGQNLLQRAPALLDELDDILGALSAETKGLTGLLRISAPLSFGEIYIKDLLSRFSALHPELTFDLRLSDTYIDLATNGIDLAFRVGTPDVSSMKARKLGVVRSGVVASPDYLSKHGTPSTPKDLLDHTCIQDTNRRDPRWVFRDQDKEIVVTPPGRFMVNSPRIARDWAISGFGIAMCPDFVLNRDIEAGRLVRVLDNYDQPIYTFSAVYLDGNVLPRKVRALIDFAIEDVKKSKLF